MLDQETFLKVKHECIKQLSQSGGYCTQAITSANDISDLLQSLLAELEKIPTIPVGFLTHITSVLFGPVAQKREILLTRLQEICNRLMCAHIENKMTSRDFQPEQHNTILDWYRARGAWKISGQACTDTTTFMQWLSILEINPVLQRFIINFANQIYCFEPISFIQKGYCDLQDLLLLDADSPAAEDENLNIIQQENNVLAIKIEKKFHRLLTSEGAPTTLVSACKITTQFNASYNNLKPTIYNLSMVIENAPDRCHHLAIILARFFLNHLSHQTLQSSRSSSPFGNNIFPGNRILSRPSSSHAERQQLTIPHSPSRPGSAAYVTAPNTPMKGQLSPLPSPQTQRRDPHDSE